MSRQGPLQRFLTSPNVDTACEILPLTRSHVKAESAALAFAGVMTIGFLVLLAVPSDESPVVDEWEITSVCLDGHDGLATHIHATLSITIHSTDRAIPASVGIQDEACENGMRGIHTHDEAGTLHIETPSPMEAPIGAFFQIWGEKFDESHIMEKEANDNYEVLMFVNGERNMEYENYIMNDGDVIEIQYR